jgi:hypothetical protein
MINKNEIEKIKQKMKIKTSNIATRVIYMDMLNEFLYENKFVIQKHIKFIKQLLFKKKQCKATHMKNLIKNQY